MSRPGRVTSRASASCLIQRLSWRQVGGLGCPDKDPCNVWMAKVLAQTQADVHPDYLGDSHYQKSMFQYHDTM